jgi:hypothetical protein
VSGHRYELLDIPVPDHVAARLADRLVLLDTRCGRLVQRLRTEQRLTVRGGR